MDNALVMVEPLVLIVLGLMSLLTGRRWLRVWAGIVGFALGWWLMGLIMSEAGWRLVVGVMVGLIVAGSIRFAGKWAKHTLAAMAGFVTVPLVLGSVGMLGGISEFVWAVFGAVLSVVCASYQIEGTLLILSAILGASLIVNSAQVFLNFVRLGYLLSEASRLVLGSLLSGIGIFIQGRRQQRT